MGVGRPSEFKGEEHCKVAREMTGNGKTMADLAEMFGVNRSTIIDWMNAHPTFAAAVKQGREDAIDKVEMALFQRATGFRHASEKIVVTGCGDGVSQVERVPIEVQYPPDTAAAKLWLTNMRAGVWKDRQNVEHSGTLTLEQLVGESLKKDPPPATDHG